MKEHSYSQETDREEPVGPRGVVSPAGRGVSTLFSNESERQLSDRKECEQLGIGVMVLF